MCWCDVSDVTLDMLADLHWQGAPSPFFGNSVVAVV
jgi:hypothetical protein